MKHKPQVTLCKEAICLYTYSDNMEIRTELSSEAARELSMSLAEHAEDFVQLSKLETERQMS
jgi:hypothetical protein